MTALAPTLQKFFTDRLARQRDVSSHTIAAYRDTFRLLLEHVHTHTRVSPAQLDLTDLDADAIVGFLTHLEQDRGNSVRTRNARLAAIHSFYAFASFEHPEHAALIQRVLAIPAKRYDRALISWLTDTELTALIGAPDTSTWLGRRDHALLTTAAQTGLRVSELTALTIDDVKLDVGAHVVRLGKGRKHRATPLTASTVKVLRVWFKAHDGARVDPVFPTRQYRRLSTDAVAKLLRKHVDAAATGCPSLATKTVTPHTLRHTAAMRLLHAGADIATIALWLGHESIETTSIYLHADMTIKQRAIDRTTPIGGRAGRYQAPDKLIGFLESL
ncbi:tyrosine-type recombinase/integrase [Leucobacter sp. HY1910]